MVRLLSSLRLVDLDLPLELRVRTSKIGERADIQASVSLLNIPFIPVS
jgi:hypothetical protein